MKTTALYTFILLFSLTILPHCKSSSPEDTATGPEDNTAQTDDSQPKDTVNPEPPKISDTPALLQSDPPMPLSQNISLEIPSDFKGSTLMLIKVYYDCKKGAAPDLYFRLTEWYDQDIARSAGEGLCEVGKGHKTGKENEYIYYLMTSQSETDRYHCRKELSKTISEHQKAGYECLITSLPAVARNRLVNILK